MKTLFYKGFWIQGDGPCPENLCVRDGCNPNQYLNGRLNIVEKPVGLCFFFATLLSTKQAIDRYQELHPSDPIFHGRWKNSPEIEQLS